MLDKGFQIRYRKFLGKAVFCKNRICEDGKNKSTNIL